MNEIFGGQTPSHSRIVAWLVKCAEDPLTRWEGTYELLRSFQRMEYIAEQAKALAPDEGADESEDEAKREDYAYPWKQTDFETGDPNFARNVSEGDKLILTNLLLKRSKDPKRASLFEHGDRELIELVKRWGDSKVAANLLDELRAGSADTDLSSELMPTIASILADGELLSISASYTSIRWQDDTAEVESEEREESAGEELAEPIEPAPRPDAAVSSEVEAVELEVTVDNMTENARPEIKQKTYGALRKDLLARYLARADKLMARDSKYEERN